MHPGFRDKSVCCRFIVNLRCEPICHLNIPEFAMELCSMFLLFAAVILVFLVACVVKSDADLTLMFADKFGRKLGNGWRKKCTARSAWPSFSS